MNLIFFLVDDSHLGHNDTPMPFVVADVSLIDQLKSMQEDQLDTTKPLPDVQDISVGSVDHLNSTIKTSPADQ